MSIVEAMEKRMALGPLDDSWYTPGGSFYGGTGIATKAGSNVSEMNAMKLAVVWCCIRILSEDTASLPLPLYRRLPRGGKERAVDHPLYNLMHTQPNPEMTSMAFRETFNAHILTWGNGYAEKEYGRGSVGSGKLLALWPIGPHRVTPYREKKQLKYKISMPNGLPNVVLPRKLMLHTPGLSYDGILGYSPIAAAREAIGLGMALEEFGERYFGDGTHPSAVLMHPGQVKDKKALREASDEVYSGLGNSHRLMLLEDGMKIEKIGIPPEDSQFLETRKFQNIDIGTRIYRLPPQMYGEFDKASSYRSAEQFALDYVTKTLRAWLVRLEQGYNTALLTPEEQKEYFFEHLVDGLLRGDMKSRFDAYSIAKSARIYTTNEIREIENRNPIEGGDKLDENPNMMPAGKTEPVKKNAMPDRIIARRKVDGVDWEAIYAEGGAHWTDDLQPSKFAQDFCQKLIDEGKKSVLEIGCGNGKDSILFALAGLKVTSIDMVQAAVDMAKENAKNAKVVVDFQTGNAEKLSFSDKTFDAVFTLSVLHATHMEKSISEVKRVLRNKGLAFIYVYSNVEKISGEIVEFISIDKFVDHLKGNNLKIEDFYTLYEDDFDEAGEKHLIIVSEVRK